jgi:hypothetical protein
LEKCGIKSGLLARAENEGKIVFNRTGKPVLSKSVSGKGIADAVADSKSAKSSASASPAGRAADNKAGGPGYPAGAKNKDGKPVPALGAKQDSRSGPVVQKSASNVSSLSSKSHLAADGTAQAESANTLPVVEPLQNVDVDMLAERFDVGGVVHYGHVIQYFNELHAAVSHSRRRNVSLPPANASGAPVSPFLVSSEWQKLRDSALKQYAIAPPPPPAPAAPAAATVSTVPPPVAPKPAPLPSAGSKKFDAADFPPGKLPPPGVEVVEPPKGMFCCGAGAARPAPAANRPEALPVRLDTKDAWDDPDAKPEAPQAAEDKGSASEQEEEQPALKMDREFNTPGKDKQLQKKLSFQPRRVTRDVDAPEENVERSGLGNKALNDSHDEPEERVVRHRNHFHRRDDRAAAGGSGKKASDLESGSEGEAENSANRTNTRGESRWR